MIGDVTVIRVIAVATSAWFVGEGLWVAASVATFSMARYDGL